MFWWDCHKTDKNRQENDFEKTYFIFSKKKIPTHFESRFSLSFHMALLSFLQEKKPSLQNYFPIGRSILDLLYLPTQNHFERRTNTEKSLKQVRLLPAGVSHNKCNRPRVTKLINVRVYMCVGFNDFSLLVLPFTLNFLRAKIIMIIGITQLTCVMLATQSPQSKHDRTHTNITSSTTAMKYMMIWYHFTFFLPLKWLSTYLLDVLHKHIYNINMV